MRDLAAQGEHGLGLAVARLLGGAAGAVALDQERLGVVRAERSFQPKAARSPYLTSSYTISKFQLWYWGLSVHSVMRALFILKPGCSFLSLREIE